MKKRRRCVRMNEIEEISCSRSNTLLYTFYASSDPNRDVSRGAFRVDTMHRSFRLTHTCTSPGLKSELFALVIRVGAADAEIQHFRTSVSVFLEGDALDAVKGVSSTLGPASNALIGGSAVATLVAEAYGALGVDERVANWALSFAASAQAADGDSRLIAA